MTAESTENQFSEQYSEAGLWAKLRRYAEIAGRELVEKALLLYFVLKRSETPKWAKTAIIGALGYFIAPVDAIPDLLPGVGYTDDLGVLVMALATVASLVTPELRAKARERVDAWFRASADSSSESSAGTADGADGDGIGAEGAPADGVDGEPPPDSASAPTRAAITSPEAP